MNVILKYQRDTAGNVVSIHLPMSTRFAVCLLVGITMSTLAVLLHPSTPATPFSDLTHLVGENTRQTALERGFICKHSEFLGGAQSTYDLCTREDADGMFSNVSLQTLGSDGTQISFLMRDNTVKLGDLVLLWGEPDIRYYCEAIVLRWSDRHTIGLASPTPDRSISYMLPIRSVIVSRSAVPKIDTLMTMQASSRCKRT